MLASSVKPEILLPPGYYFDQEKADRAANFFPRFLRHTKGEWAGQPFNLEPWQEQNIIRPLFGNHRADGSRQYRTAFVAIPRKAGKSTTAAGIALYTLTADQEMGAEIYSAAADRDQARIVFEQARQMVEAHPALRDRVKCYKSAFVVESTGSVYRVLSADAYSKHGLNAHAVIFDELHAQANRELWDVLTTSTGARRQPLTFAITTAGHDRHSICYEQWDYAEKVRDGVIDDPSFLTCIYAAHPDADWRDPATWYAAHPGLGVSIKRDYFETECAKARSVPRYENTFRRLLLNQWTEADARWLSSDAWNACGGELPDLTGLTCWAGLDLATTTDIAALVLAFPEGAEMRLLPFFFVPQENINKRALRDRVPYDQWALQGHIIATPGAVIDYEVIRRTVNELAEKYHIKEIAVDRWNATQLATQLTGDGFEMVGFGQGFASMSAPTKEFEARVIGKTLRHGDNPVLTWMAANVAVEMDAAGNVKPSKKKSTERIDGIAAAIMAIGRAMVNQDAPIDTSVMFV
ncbi:terminase TerL endonuclease subunit [Pseudomonas sp. TMP25]|uniref:terminase large subunit n=1 Tax=Pseudomonas sp. TMP25 TaxID=3136561 RepID=UPI003100D687